MEQQALIKANKKLYSGVTDALIEAAKRLGVSGSINFWIFNNNNNPKMPKNDLHDALLKEGKANSVKTDDVTKHIFVVGSNDGTREQKIKAHLHLATLMIR